MLDLKGGLVLLSLAVLVTPPLEAQERSRSTFISSEEIERLGPRGTALDIVRSLRPRWLQVRDVIRLPSGGSEMETTQVRVYLDDRDVGGVDYLRSIPADRVHSLRYVSTTEAGARYGPALGPGIVVTLKR